MKKKIALMLGALMGLSMAACKNPDTGAGGPSNGPSVRDLGEQAFTLSQLSGTDALDRTISASSEKKENKYVGIYYFLWFGYHSHKIYDTSEILEKYENGIVGNPENPLWVVDPSSPYYDLGVSPNGAFHYWDEPLYGYYDSDDPWVARKHLELLAYADVDYLLLDYTNTYIYETSTTVLIEAILEMQQEGWDVPQIAFMLPPNDGSIDTFKRVYAEYISKPEYASAFFVADEEMNPSGKPLVTGSFSREDVGDIFDSIWHKPLQWPDRSYEDNALPWIDWDPKNNQHNHNGVMSVSIAQHTGGVWSSCPYLYPGEQFFRGRGWVSTDPLNNGASEENVMKGTNFEYQWNNVFNAEEEVDMVVVTGWNEWIAQKQSTLQKPYHTSLKAVFVDSFNMAYSRDSEPMKGGYGDNYYLQLLANIRKFKYGDAASGAVENVKKTIDITKGMSEWTNVSDIYLDLGGETVNRNYKSVDPSIVYTDDTARNDVVTLKFANDNENLYIRVETKEDITAYQADDASWMNVYLSTGETGGWENYNYLINRSPAGNSTSVEKFVGNSLQSVGTASYFVDGNYIFYAIPLSALGVTSAKEIGIKITDNVQPLSSIDDFYTKGECAPVGRLNYAYKLA